MPELPDFIWLVLYRQSLSAKFRSHFDWYVQHMLDNPGEVRYSQVFVNESDILDEELEANT